jgi:VWFA-related protein
MRLARRDQWIAAAAALTAVAAGVHAQGGQTFRTITRLVEVSVVVTDREGKPVTDLRREDFTLNEDRVPQSISIFQVNDGRAAATAMIPLPDAGVPMFSNAAGPAASATSVLLLDSLNAAFDSQYFARRHLDRYLKASRPGDRFALYALDGALRVLHDFTDDHVSLRNAVDRYRINRAAVYDASQEPPAELAEGGISVWIADPSGNMADFFTERRAHNTFDALHALADHLSGVAGRKSLVWLSEGFSIPEGPGRAEFLHRLRRAMQSLSDAQVVLYPVDARGLVGAQTVSPRGQVRFTTFRAIRGNIEMMDVVAEETGGRAFKNTNALDRSIQSAVDDSRFTYLLGYYPADATSNGRYRNIKVAVRKPGLTVRHRRGYFSSPRAADQRSRNAALRDALQAPLQATEIALRATAERDESRVTLSVRIDPATLTFDRSGNGWRGAVDMIFAVVSRRGIATIADTAQLDITLTEDGRRKAEREGLPVVRTIGLRPDTFELRIVARDVSTGHIGSIVIPTSRLTQ